MPSYKRIQRKIPVSHNCGHDSIIVDYDMPGLAPRERRQYCMTRAFVEMVAGVMIDGN